MLMLSKSFMLLAELIMAALSLELNVGILLA